MSIWWYLLKHQCPRSLEDRVLMITLSQVLCKDGWVNFRMFSAFHLVTLSTKQDVNVNTISSFFLSNWSKISRVLNYPYNYVPLIALSMH